MIARSARFAALLFFVCFPALAAGRHVVFVDGTRTDDGAGTRDRPFRKLAQAQASSALGDVIYVAEAQYDEGILLKKGQMLIGSAYGLEAVRVDLKAELDAPIVAAVQGPGPSIHGTITMAGDNVVAGLTSIADKGAGVVASMPDGALTFRNVWFRPSRDGYAMALQETHGAISIAGGGMIAADRASGITIYGGSGNVTVEHFPISGSFGSVIALSGRSAGTIAFGKGSPIKIDDAARDAIYVSGVVGTVVFDEPLSIVTHGGRGLVIENSKKVSVAAGTKIAATNAPAVHIVNSTVDVQLENVTAAALPPGRLSEGINVNGMHGRFAVNSGAIRDAQAYGIRIEQSDPVKIANVEIVESGAVAGKLQCPEDLSAVADVVCRGGLFLRHVKGATLENIVVDGGSKNGLVANNVGDLTIRQADFRRSGALLQELSGNVTFNICKFADGGGVAVEQRFNRARLAFDHCTFSAPNQPQNSPFLFRARTNGFSALDVAMKNCDLNDNVGGGIDLRSTDTSTLAVSLTDTNLQRLGGIAITGIAEKGSHAIVELHNARVFTPAVHDPSVQLTAADTATLCTDI
ncbi:MAG TPA: right-handed parallel beta-helix repeat-containing protein, partial [Thermoanaerobaculia bacterium]|nr:right-handed parallel beta-helix repeat-containing protein [Thermoanaerobaculia bacterium]